MRPPDRSIIYRVSRDGHVMGDHDIDQIAKMLKWGEFFETDLYFAEGMSDWDELASLKKEVEAARAHPPGQAAPTAPVRSRPKVKAPPPRARLACKPGRQAHPVAASWSPAGLLPGLCLGLLCGYLWTVFFPQEKTVTIERTREVPVERVIATDVGSAVTADDLRRLGLGAAVEAALVTERDDHKLFPLAAGSPIEVRVEIMGSVAGGRLPAEKVRARVEQLLTARGLRVAPPAEAAETRLTVDVQLFGDADDIAGHIGMTFYQTIHAGRDRIWRKGAYPVWRRSKYFTGYDKETLSLLPLLTDELTADIAAALQRLDPAR